jgi:hypothetical protein
MAEIRTLVLQNFYGCRVSLFPHNDTLPTVANGRYYLMITFKACAVVFGIQIVQSAPHIP